MASKGETVGGLLWWLIDEDVRAETHSYYILL